jgi:tripartite-type tricarboxylate transporter receptor subunit TctC
MNRLLAAASAGLILVSAASAWAAEDFYKGKSVKMMIGGSVGGSYDSHARILAKHMTKHIPGNPTIVAMQMPAAAGLAATNHLNNIALKDGTEFGLVNRYNLVAPLLGNEQAKYKVEEFNWLGTTASYSDDAYVFIIRASLPQKTVDDLRGGKFAPLNVGNVGSAPIRVLEEANGIKLNVIEGYTGNDLDLAFERGEVDGHTVGYGNMLARQSNWVSSGFIRTMVQFGRVTRLPALKDVPTSRELATTPENLALIEFSEAPLTIAYPFVLPPGVPADRVAIMRKAFEDTVKDPDYLAEMKKANLETTPKSGAEIQQTIVKLTKTPAEVVKRYKDLSAGKAGGG